MPRIAPLPVSEATDKAEQTYGRIQEMFGDQTIPEPFLYYGRVPAFLQDFYMNFKRFVRGEGKLSPQRRAVIALAVSAHFRCQLWTDYFVEYCRDVGLEESTVADVAAPNNMYNASFKFRDISGSSIFEGMSVGLRAHTFANTSLDEATVELLNIAISDLNACKPCTSGHVQAVRDMGVSDDESLEAIQCAATMAAGAHFLNSIDA